MPQTSRTSVWHRLSVLACVVAAVLWASAAQATYRLDAGDVLQVDVFGVQDFQRHVTVNADGEISIPFLGEVKATGLSLDELRKDVQARLAQTGTMRSPDVTIEVVEYRPFYVTGDVARPGAVAYRPGVTVRHAVALAGGYDALRFRAENPLLAGPEFRSQYESLWTELVRRRARAISLQAQLDGKTEIDLKELEAAPVSRSAVLEIADLEVRDLRLRLSTYQKERVYLTAARSKAAADITALQRALQEGVTMSDEQSGALSRATDGQSRGLIASVRVDEERRELANSRMHQVETGARLVQARKEDDELGRRQATLVDDYQSKLVQDLQDTVVEVEKVKAQIRSVGEKLAYTGALKAQLRGESGGPEVIIHRVSSEGHSSLAATEDSDVLPGDVVEISIRPEQLIVAPPLTR